MATGRVKWFSDARGYGFITPDRGGPDLFVHYTSIADSGFKTLTEGAAVEFDVREGGRAWRRSMSYRSAGQNRPLQRGKARGSASRCRADALSRVADR